MDQAQLTFGILAFIILTLPILTVLWKIFTAREKLAIGIAQNHHLLKMQEQHFDDMRDQQALFLNGIVERLQHVRDRSKEKEEDLEKRITDLEFFIEKTTEFTRRRS